MNPSNPDPHQLDGPTPALCPADPAALVAAGFGAEEATEEVTWVPWGWDGDTLLVATSVPPGLSLHAEVVTRTGAPRIRFLRADGSDLERAVCQAREWLRHQASEQLAEQAPRFSAKYGLLPWQALVPALILVVVGLDLVLSWRATIIVLFAAGNLAFFANSAFKVVASLLRPLYRNNERRIQTSASPLDDAATDDLPIYTILVPVYREAAVIGSIMRNFERLDYPPDRLDVLILLEADDTETIAAARHAGPPPWMRLVIVPDGQPRTKPRACNYGLALARGEYVVIYDAEDRPEPDQLKKALARFRHDSGQRLAGSASRPLACIQASLNFYNPDYNVLTRMFAIEYAQWFDSMLAGLTSTQTPLPLGGTSNHFLRSALEQVGAWDPYNVTEDADLGLRLAASGYRVDLMDSTTWEEATSQVVPWIRQRTRWIKGYLLTAAVNLRNTFQWVRTNGWRATITMVGLILSTPLNFLLYPLTLGFTLVAWLLGPVVQIHLPPTLLLLGSVNLVGMNLFMIITSIVASWRRYNWRIAAFSVFLPVYWLLHSVAAWRAMLQLAWAPHTWEKTPHGLGEDYDDSTVDVGDLARTARG